MSLNEERKRAGNEVLKILDRVGFATQAVGWMRGVEEGDAEGEWKLFLVTPLLEEMGPKWIHERLLKAFHKIGLPCGVTPLDIYVIGPDHPIYSRVPFRIDLGRGEFFVSDAIVDVSEGLQYTSLYFFRFKKGPVKARPRQFDMKVRRLLAA